MPLREIARSSRRLRTRAHASGAKAGYKASSVSIGAVVAHRHDDHLLIFIHLDGHRSRPGMAHHISEGLLQDTVQGYACLNGPH